MKIVAIDAGRGHCTVSQSLDAAARAAESTGALVLRRRLSDLHIRECVGCKLCALGDGCMIDDDLRELSALIAEADGVIVGAPPGLRGASSRAFAALLARLRTWFEDEGAAVQPHLPGFGPGEVHLSGAARATKRAIIITSASAPGPLGAFFNNSSGQIRSLRQALAACRISAVGAMDVPNLAGGADLSDHEWDRAISLGRLLAGKV